MEEVIRLENLSKVFKIRKSFSGIPGAFKGLFSRSFSSLEAVHEISFSIRKGERVAFIGPNGAGKSTTILLMSKVKPVKKRQTLRYDDSSLTSDLKAEAT